MYIKQAHSTQQNARDLPNYFKKIDFKFERLVQVRMNNNNDILLVMIPLALVYSSNYMHQFHQS